MSGGPRCAALQGALRAEHPCPARAWLGRPCLPQGSSKGVCGVPHPLWHPQRREGTAARCLAPLPPPQAPAWGAWSRHAEGSVCPAEDAQHPAQLRLRWHLPFIGCGGGSRGAGPTLSPGVVLRGGSLGAPEGWWDVASGSGGGATAPALPSHLSPWPCWPREPSTSPEGLILPLAHPSRCSETVACTSAVMVSRPCSCRRVEATCVPPPQFVPRSPGAGPQPRCQQLEGWHCTLRARGP